MKLENIFMWTLGGLVLYRMSRGGDNTEGIGKLYDSYGIKPHGRVDDYWRTLKVNWRALGREENKLPHYVDPLKAVEHFNLHSIEFGNWMNQNDRFTFMFSSLVSLADMAKAMNVPQGVMGLKQRISLAFGARGHGGFAAAFYQGTPIAVINLTKTKGPGTLAHEFGHAIDENLHLKIFGQRGMMTGGRTASKQTAPEDLDKGTVEYFFEKVFDILFWKENGEPTAFQLEQKKRGEYWNRREEVWARTFERFIEIKFDEKGITNKWAINPSGRDDLPPKALVVKAIPYIQRIIKAAF